MELARRGDTTALDLLHSQKESTYITSDLWECLRANRKMFYTKNLRAFIGYAKNQAAKYGIKGDRLQSIENCLSFLMGSSKVTKLSEVWEELPVDAHSKFIDDSPNGVLQYKICGKILQATMSIEYAEDILIRYKKAFGDRSIMAQTNEGVDWKALSHALRASLQVREILKTGDLRFPLKNAVALKFIKEGFSEYKLVVSALDALIEEVEELSEKSEYPESVSKDECDSFLLLLLKVF
jgi:hypothetical protein